jgi:hypothetical protein
MEGGAMQDIGINIIFKAVKKEYAQAISGIKKDAGQLQKRFKMAGAALTGFAVAGTAALANMASEFNSNERASALLSNTLKQNAGLVKLNRDEITSWAKDYSRATGTAQAEIESAAARMLTFKNVQGDTFKEGIRLASDLSAVYGNDLRMSTIQIGKALNDPVKGMSALNRVGVQFTDTQREMAKQMMAAGNVAGAQAIVLKELRNQVGGTSEEIGKTLTGSLNIANNEFAELKAEIFAGLVPVLKTLLQDYIIPMLQWFRELSPEVKATIGVMAGLAVAVAAVGGPMLLLIGYIPQIVAGLKAAAAGMTILKASIMPVIAKLAILTAAFYSGYQIGKKLVELFDPLRNFFDAAANFKIGGMSIANFGIDQPAGLSAKGQALQAQMSTTVINNPTFDTEQQLRKLTSDINTDRATAPAF